MIRPTTFAPREVDFFLIAETYAVPITACHDYLCGPLWMPWLPRHCTLDHLQEPETWHALGYFRRPLTRDAFRDLLLQVNPDELEAALWKWVTNGMAYAIRSDPRMAYAT